MAGSSTGIAILTVSLGTWLGYSALTGKSLADALTGGSPLDPAGGKASPTELGQAPTADSVGTGGGGSPIGASAMEAEMNRMIALHLPYRWGGGHGAQASKTGPWDCSGAVSQVVNFLGLMKGTKTSTGFMTEGKAGSGKTFTIYANPTHVFIHMNDGIYAGQDWGTTSRIPADGGSLKWQIHTKVGFVARHYEGY